MGLRPKLLGQTQWALGSGECLGIRNNLKQSTSCTTLFPKTSWELRYTNLPRMLCKEHNLVITQTLLPILETGVQHVAKHSSSWGYHGVLERTLQTPAGFANAKEGDAPSACHTAFLFSIQWQLVSKLDKQSKQKEWEQRTAGELLMVEQAVLWIWTEHQGPIQDLLQGLLQAFIWYLMQVLDSFSFM